MMASQFHLLSIIWTTSHLVELLEKPLKTKENALLGLGLVKL